MHFTPEPLLGVIKEYTECGLILKMFLEKGSLKSHCYKHSRMFMNNSLNRYHRLAQ